MTDVKITQSMIELPSIGSVLDTHERMCYAVMKDGEHYPNAAYFHAARKKSTTAPSETL